MALYKHQTLHAADGNEHWYFMAERRGNMSDTPSRLPSLVPTSPSVGSGYASPSDMTSLLQERQYNEPGYYRPAAPSLVGYRQDKCSYREPVPYGRNTLTHHEGSSVRQYERDAPSPRFAPYSVSNIGMNRYSRPEGPIRDTVSHCPRTPPVIRRQQVTSSVNARPVTRAATPYWSSSSPAPGGPVSSDFFGYSSTPHKAADIPEAQKPHIITAEPPPSWRAPTPGYGIPVPAPVSKSNLRPCNRCRWGVINCTKIRKSTGQACQKACYERSRRPGEYCDDPDCIPEQSANGYEWLGSGGREWRCDYHRGEGRGHFLRHSSSRKRVTSCGAQRGRSRAKDRSFTGLVIRALT